MHEFVALGATLEGAHVLDAATLQQVVASPTAMCQRNQTQQVPLPWAFPCLQGPINTISLNSDGWLTFEPTTTTDSTESVNDLLNGPARLAFLWDDLDPSAGGTIHAEAVGASEFHITFTSVPERTIVGTANTCQVVLHMTGAIEVRYGTLTTPDMLVGLSSGHGATNPGATDYSALSTASVTITTGVGPFLPILSLSANSRPVLGSNWDLQVNVIPAGTPFGAHFFGFTNPGTVDLASIGMPGCGQYSSVDAVGGLWVPTVGVPYQYSFAVPSQAWLIGLELFTQTLLATNPPTNQLGFESTNGIKGSIGDL